MNPIEIARDIISIGTTAGIKKDVLDLQAAKLRILTDELALSKQRESKLAIENNQLRALLKNPPPVVLDDACTEMLQAVANSPDRAWKHELFAQFGHSTAKGEHIFDQLVAHKFIDVIPCITPDGAPYMATQEGREYLNKKGLL